MRRVGGSRSGEGVKIRAVRRGRAKSIEPKRGTKTCISEEMLKNVDIPTDLVEVSMARNEP
jgi:hypothetical protein